MIKRPEIDRTLVVAAICSAALIGNYLGLKAVRDDLFQNWDLRTAFPAVKIATGLLAIVAAGVMGRVLASIPPAWLLPRAFLGSAAVLLALWPLARVKDTYKYAGLGVHFHMAIFSLVLIAGFWTMVNMRYDPRAAKRLIGIISAAGTVGGLAGAQLQARIHDPRILIPVFAGLHVLAAVFIGALKPPQVPKLAPVPASPPRERKWGVELLHRQPYLRTVALLLFCASLSAGFLEYVFQNEIQSHFGSSPAGRAARSAFFGNYYSVLPLITLALQVLLSRLLLEKAGLAVTAASVPVGVALSGAGALAFPGFSMAIVARGTENTLRQSLFKSAWEIFYTPVTPKERSSAKSVIDVGAECLGDVVGGALLLAAGLAARQVPTLVPVLNRASLSVSVLLSLVILALLWWLKSAYVRELEASLLNRSVVLEPDKVRDRTSHTVMLKTQMLQEGAARPAAPLEMVPRTADTMLEAIADLRSSDPERVRAALAGHLTGPLVALAIPLLGRDDVARDAAAALSRIAEGHTGQFADVLLDPAQEPALRRRVARLLGVVGGQRAADGLVLALADQRFDVRVQCGRALAAITGKDSEVRVAAGTIFAAVVREVDSSASVWEGQIELERAEGAPDPTADELIRERSGRALEHVFTLLSLVLPREPLKVAYQGLQSGDQNLRGTVLEYLESIFPAGVREKIWPFLEDVRRKLPEARARQEVVAEVMRLHESLRVKLEEIRGDGAGE